LSENIPTNSGLNSTDPTPPSDPKLIFQIGRRGLAPVTLGIIVLTVLFFLLQYFTSYIFGYDLFEFWFAKINEFILQGQLWRLVTPIFLHGNVLHIGMNMYALFVIGPVIERSFGWRRFLALYLLAGGFGNVLSFLFTAEPSLGASTSIFGLVAAQAVYVYRNRTFFGKAAQPMLINIAIIIFINLAIGLIPGIDYWGHVGGLIGGLIFAWLAGPVYETFDAPFGTALVEKKGRQLSWVILNESIFIALITLTKFIFQ
jgi:rhomboid protease GluP